MPIALANRVRAFAQTVASALRDGNAVDIAIFSALDAARLPVIAAVLRIRVPDEQKAETRH